MTTELIGFAAVAVCAVTGVLEAGRKPMDLFGVVVIALVAALGGGTLRDLLLDRPVFWVHDPRHLVAALLAGLATFLVARLVRVPPRLFLVPDAMGLALFTVLGTRIALDLDAHWLVASLMGVITGVFGGIVRDVLCNEVPLVFGGELYATAAWSGALLLVVLHARGIDPQWQSLLPMLLVFALRMAGIWWRIHLPRLELR